MESCLWADDVRPWRKETAPHHYVNVPHGAREIDLARDCPPEVGCVVTEVLVQAGNMRRTYSKDALRFMANFAGDMHQPLHAGYADDAGANGIKGKKTPIFTACGILACSTPPGAPGRKLPRI